MAAPPAAHLEGLARELTSAVAAKHPASQDTFADHLAKRRGDLNAFMVARWENGATCEVPDDLRQTIADLLGDEPNRTRTT